MRIVVCKLSQNTTLQITHAVKEWDKGTIVTSYCSEGHLSAGKFNRTLVATGRYPANVATSWQERFATFRQQWDGIPENELHVSHLEKFGGTPEMVRPRIPLA